jgi:hypothetical protein
MKSLYHYILLGMLLFLASCEQILLPDDPKTDPQSIFEECWIFADQEYSFFELKQVDWDQVKSDYELKIQPNMTERALFDTLAQMLFLLRDGHVNLFSDFDISRNWQWNLDFPTNFDLNLLERTYWQDQQRLASPFITFDFGEVGYIRYSSFSESISDGVMSLVLEDFKDHKGLIIDVRDNGGGSISNINRFVKRFISEEFVYGQERHKNGPGRNDFTAWKDLTISPDEELSTYGGPIIVLTNRSCYSACNDFVAALSALPQVTIVGDQTGGGGGLPAQTQLANGWSLRVSSSQTLDHQGLSIEEGIAPDVKIDLIDGTGRDEILDKALEILGN